MNEKTFYKTFASMTAVIALQNIIVFGVNLADSVMMGAYSETALSGVGICNNIQYLLMMINIGLTNGMTVISSRYWGEGNRESVKKNSAVVMLLGIGVSLLMTVLCGLIPSNVISLFTDKQTVAAQAVEYLDIIKYSYVVFGVTQIIIAILRSVETVKIGFYVSLSSFGLNILLNYLLIFGKAGFPEMGIRGAAIATLVSRITELVVSVIYILAVDKKLKCTIKDLFSTNKKMITDYLRTGLPLAFSSISWGLAMSIQGAIIGRFTESAIAANSIVTTLFQIAAVVCYASGSSTCVLFSKAIGEGATLDTIKKRTRTIQLIYVVIGIFSSVVLVASKFAIIGFYNASAETIRYTNQFTAVLAVTIIGTSYECPALTGIVSGGGDTSFVLKNDFIFMWLFVLPVSAASAFIFKFPPVVTFACLKSDQVLKCAVAYVKVRKYNWIKKIGA